MGNWLALGYRLHKGIVQEGRTPAEVYEEMQSALTDHQRRVLRETIEEVYGFAGQHVQARSLEWEEIQALRREQTRERNRAYRAEHRNEDVKAAAILRRLGHDDDAPSPVRVEFDLWLPRQTLTLDEYDRRTMGHGVGAWHRRDRARRSVFHGDICTGRTEDATM